MATKMYGNAAKAFLNKEVDWDSDNIKVMLMASSYAPNQDTHDYLDDVSAHEVSGTGYTAGGALLTGKVVSYDSATNTVKFDANDVTWANSSITARYAVVYNDSGASAANKPLIAYYDFVTDRASSNGDFVIRWSADGVFTATTA